MAFQADILVTECDGFGIALVVEVKTGIGQDDDSDRPLKRYMASMAVPIGVLVTPQTLWLYRNRYLPSPEESIWRIAEFDIVDLFRFKPTGDDHRDSLLLQEAVQFWLEGLRTEAGLRSLPADLRESVELYVLPAISQGVIGAGHPREILPA